MITVTGNLADDPHTFRTGDSQVGYVKAVAFGVLASHAAESVRKGDRVTIQGHDLTAEAWVNEAGEPRGRVRIAVTEIAASLRFDTVTTGRSVCGAHRDAGRAADAAVQAERAVLAAVTR